MERLIPDEAATLALGAALARVCVPGTVIYLIGELGAGKTTLVRGWLRSLGYGGAVKSPTYTLVEPYDVAGFRIYHFDLYRLIDPDELEYLGLRDCLDDHSLLLIEWPSRGGDRLPPADLTITLRHQTTGRRVEITAQTPRGVSLVSQLDTAGLSPG